MHSGLLTATAIAGFAVRLRSAALVLQPHLRLTTLPTKSDWLAHTVLKLAVIVTAACRQGSRRDCGVFELGGDVELGELIASDEDVQMMSL